MSLVLFGCFLGFVVVLVLSHQNPVYIVYLYSTEYKIFTANISSAFRFHEIYRYYRNSYVQAV